MTAIFANRNAYAALCSNHTVVAWGDWSADHSAISRAELVLSSGIRTIFSHPQGGSFVAIKDSALDEQPPGCTVWTYSHGRYALLLDDRSTANGQCREGFRCLCACETTFEGEVNSSAPGNFSLRISSGELQCKQQELRELECNENQGYVRAWDSENKVDYCRIKVSHMCTTAKVMVGSKEVRGKTVAQIGDETTVTVTLAGWQPTGSPAKLQIRPVQAVAADTLVHVSGTSTLSLNTTGTFEIHFSDGPSSCKIPSQLELECKDQYQQEGKTCRKVAKDNRVCTQQVACTCARIAVRARTWMRLCASACACECVHTGRR